VLPTSQQSAASEQRCIREVLVAQLALKRPRFSFAAWLIGYQSVEQNLWGVSPTLPAKAGNEGTKSATGNNI
jgi:hypothetical protein